jgi:hypothetical protein
MWKQPSKNKKELRESYLKMPPEALLMRKMGPNVAVDAEELARAQWFWERRPKKTHSVHGKSIGYPDFLCRHLGGCSVPRRPAFGGNDGPIGFWVYRRSGDASVGLPRCCAVCSMEFGLFVRSLQASSTGSSPIARGQFVRRGTSKI